MLGILDGTVLPADEVRIPARDEGPLRGDGVFEVLRLYDGHPFALDDHLERTKRSRATCFSRSVPRRFAPTSRRCSTPGSRPTASCACSSRAAGIGSASSSRSRCCPTRSR